MQPEHDIDRLILELNATQPPEPVQVTPGVEATAVSVPAAPTAPPVSKPPTRSGVIELEIAGVQLRVRGVVDEASLCSVLRALRQTP